MSKKLKIIGGVVGAFIVIGAIASGGGSEEPTKAETPASSVAETPVADQSPAETKSAKPKPKLSLSKANAMAQAEMYLETMPFSKKGLLEQLSSDYGSGFKKADAVYAVNHVKVDWNAEALEAAKAYQDTMHMSRSQLFDQLTSSYGAGFTKAQATYAVNKLGL